MASVVSAAASPQSEAKIRKTLERRERKIQRLEGQLAQYKALVEKYNLLPLDDDKTLSPIGSDSSESANEAEDYAESAVELADSDNDATDSGTDFDTATIPSPLTPHETPILSPTLEAMEVARWVSSRERVYMREGRRGSEAFFAMLSSGCRNMVVTDEEPSARSSSDSSDDSSDESSSWIANHTFDELDAFMTVQHDVREQRLRKESGSDIIPTTSSSNVPASPALDKTRKVQRRRSLKMLRKEKADSISRPGSSAEFKFGTVSRCSSGDSGGYSTKLVSSPKGKGSKILLNSGAPIDDCVVHVGRSSQEMRTVKTSQTPSGVNSEAKIKRLSTLFYTPQSRLRQSSAPVFPAAISPKDSPLSPKSSSDASIPLALRIPPSTPPHGPSQSAVRAAVLTPETVRRSLMSSSPSRSRLPIAREAIDAASSGVAQLHMLRLEHELIETEETYITGLRTLKLMETIAKEEKMLGEGDAKQLFFPQLSALINVHAAFVERLKSQEVPLVQTLNGFIPSLQKFYSSFYQHHVRGARTMKKCASRSELSKLSQRATDLIAKSAEIVLPEEEGDFEAPSSSIIHFESVYILPIQRLPRYEMLMHGLAKHAVTDEDRIAYTALASQMEETNANLNEELIKCESKFRIQEIQSLLGNTQHKLGYLFILNEKRRQYIYEGTLQTKNGKDKEQIFVFNDILLNTSLLNEKGGDTELEFKRLFYITQNKNLLKRAVACDFQEPCILLDSTGNELELRLPSQSGPRKAWLAAFKKVLA